MRTIRTSEFENGFGEKRQIDPKREMRVKVCHKWAPPLSAKAAENFDKIFGEREQREAGRVAKPAPLESVLAVAAYRENFDAIFGKREPADFDDEPRTKR